MSFVYSAYEPSLIICENADPTPVRKDLERFMQRFIPDSDEVFQHTTKGTDDMPNHLRTILTQTSLTIPIEDNKFVFRYLGDFIFGSIALIVIFDIA